MSSSENDSEDENKVLSHSVDKNTISHKKVEKTGPVSMDVLSSEKKLFIVRMPKRLIDPLSLINAKVTVGGGRISQMSVKEQNLEAVTFPTSSDTPGPALFLPDSNGELHQADGAIIGQVHLRQGLQNENSQSLIDIDSLRSIVHKPPEDLKERHFFVRSENSVSPRRKKKKSKRSIDPDSISISASPLKNKSNENDMLQTNSPGTPKIKKKKTTNESPKKDVTYDSSFTESPRIASSSKKNKKKKKIDQV